MYYKVLLFMVSLSLVTSCTPSLRLTYHDFSKPIFYAEQRGALNPSQSILKSGLQVAIWLDGRILRAKSASTVGLEYYYGKLNSQNLETVIERIQTLYKSDIKSPGVPIDCASRSISLFPEGVDPLIAPGYFYAPDIEENFEPENALQDFMQMEIEEIKTLSWDQLPRFGPPVFGVW